MAFNIKIGDDVVLSDRLEKIYGDNLPMAAIEKTSDLIQHISMFERCPTESGRLDLIDGIIDAYIYISALTHHYCIADGDLLVRLEENVHYINLIESQRGENDETVSTSV